MQWNSAWPIQVTTSFAQNLLNSAPFLPSPPSIIPNVASDVNRVLSGLASIQNALNGLIGSTDTDKTHLAGLSSLSSLSKGVTTRNQAVYMAAVSPWFFTHYGQDSFNKNVRIFLGLRNSFSHSPIVHLFVGSTSLLKALGISHRDEGSSRYRSNLELE